MLQCAVYCCGCLAVLLALLLLYGLNPVARWRHRRLRGPRPAPFVGNLGQLGGKGKSHETLARWAHQYGPIYRFFLGRHPCIVLTDPDLVRQVGQKRFVDFHDRSLPAQELVGDPGVNLFQNSGIMFARGKHWLGIRTACVPLFHSAALASYAPMMNAAVDRLLGKLAATARGGKGVCVSQLLRGMSMDVIGDTVFGVGLGAQQEGSGSELLEASEAVFKPKSGLPYWAAVLSLAIPELRRLWFCLAQALHPDIIDKAVAARRSLWGAARALLDRARQPGAAAGSLAFQPLGGVAREAEQSAAFQRAYAAFADSVPSESSIVSRLRDGVNKQTGQPLTSLDVCAQLFTFLLAGYETTSLALSYALYLLAQHPHHQQLIMEEVAGLGGAELACEDLARLQHTRAAFMEAMRLYPPVSPLLALAREPRSGGVELLLGDGSKAFLPGGSRIMFNVWALHRDPRYWQDPLSFRPERFLPGSAEEATRHPGAYFPFGLGPRKCIGWRFALEEGVLCLARIFQRFEVRLDAQRHTDPLDLRSSITLAPHGGIWLRVAERQR